MRSPTGLLKDTAYEIGKVNVTAPEVKPTPAPSPNALEVIFATDHSLLDGRFIDNAWLQEAPDPVTKLTWDNAAQISPITAKELGIYDKVIALEPKTPLMRIGTKVKVSKRYETGEGEGNHSPMIDLTVNGREIRVPVLIAYGHADNAITLPSDMVKLPMMVGKEQSSLIENEPVVGHVGLNTGFNAYSLRTNDTPYFATGGVVKNTEEKYPVALTQEHNSMYGRALAREISTDDVAGKGGFQKAD